MKNWKAGFDKKNGKCIMESPAMAITLGTREGLRAISWLNKLTGRESPLAGPELEVSLDAAQRRIWIAGWRCQSGGQGSMPADEESGFQAGMHKFGFNDTDWKCRENPINGAYKGPGCCIWARTQIFLPSEDEGKNITLLLGGYGLYDLGLMRVFWNGQFIAQRKAERFWSDPLALKLTPGEANYKLLRWGRLNLLAIQGGGQITRTARLDELDPSGSMHLPGPEILASPFMQCLVVGEPLKKPIFKVSADPKVQDDCIIVELTAESAPLSATITYKPDPSGAILHKFTKIHNTGASAERIMDICLGSYETSASVSQGQRGFPVYVNDDYSLSLAHPSGWAVGQDGGVKLHQHPGCELAGGGSFSCMEAVLGVAQGGSARQAFVGHVRGRMRRTRRNHDKPYAIFENFGSWSLKEKGQDWTTNSESYCLHSIARLAEDQRQTGCRFDLFSVDFWTDINADLETFAADRFPQGLDNINRELAKLGTQPGMWIDSSMSGWSIGKNPAVQGNFTYNPEYVPPYWGGAFFCQACDPIKTLYTAAFRHHIRANKIKHLKLDNLRSYCSNIRHDHLPGLYSTEPIHNAVIEILSAMDDECPDIFLIFYWGYRSPWWLLHGDTLFEPGLNIEASSPSGSPTLYVRDGVTVGLDQAQWWSHDIPPLGKDSLGVWLSDWGWNSAIGTERWQEGFVMDLCRGSLLAQPWSDWNWLDPPQRQQMADFIALLRAQPGCFINSRFILGNPWRYEPYGYCCTDGQRAFLAINNQTWSDAAVELQLDRRWGLADGASWDIYRWHPNPTRLELKPDKDGTSRLSLRPFQVVLLEVVRQGRPPSLERDLPVDQPRARFTHPSRPLSFDWREDPQAVHMELPIESQKTEEPIPPKRTIVCTGSIPPAHASGLIVASLELFQDGKLLNRNKPGSYYSAKASINDRPVRTEAVVREQGYPCGWQAWRIPLDPSDKQATFSFNVTFAAQADVKVRSQVHFLPKDIEDLTPS